MAEQKVALNKGLVAIILGSALAFWIARAFAGTGPIRTPFGVLLTESNNDTRFNAKVGDIITVTLWSTPAIGSWRISLSNDPLFNQPTTSSGIEVRRGTIRQSRSWKLTPEMIGTHRVQLDYQRGNEPPTKAFSFVVTVTQ